MIQSKRPVQPDDLFKMEFLQGGKLSPDGKWVVYAVSHTEDDKDYAALWLMNLADRSTRQITSGKHIDANPQWSPDGKRLAFISTRGGAPQIYLMNIDGGEAKPLTKLPQGVAGGPAWSPDGKRIAFNAGLPPEPPPDPTKPYRVSRRVYRFDGLGYLDRAVQDIYVIDTAGGQPKRLTRDGFLNTAPRWSPDGTEILYSFAMSPTTPRFLPGLRAVKLDGQKRDVVAAWGVVNAAEWLPDGSQIVFVGQPDGMMMGSKYDLYVIDAAGEAAGCTPENRTAALAEGVGGGLQPDMPAMGILAPNMLIMPDGSAVYLSNQIGGTMQIYRVALKGPEDCHTVLGGDRALLLLGGTTQQLLYAQSTFNDPAQLFVADIEGGNEQQLTTVNATLSSQLAEPKVERLLFCGPDNVQIEGWIMTPPFGKPPYPTILYIHGGPWSAFGNIYAFDFQMLAGAGYAVLFVNYRGSGGYGDAFGTAIQGDWGNLDYQDQMRALDLVIEKGITDPDRLGVCGISAGGYGTCWMIGHTDRFKAAVPENPVTNLSTIYSVGDIGEIIVRFMGGKPHEVPENYQRCSPITYAHHCKTPTLFIQGEADFRCPAEQSEQFYTVLKDNGCIVEMLRLPNSPHVGSIAGPPAIRRAQNEALLDWMNRYVLGKST